MAQAVTKSGVINTGPDAIRAVLLDVPGYPNWQNECRKAELLTSDDQGRPATARMSISAMGQAAEYVVEYLYPDEQTIGWKLVEGDLITQNDATFVVQDKGDGTSAIDVELQIDVKFNLPDFMINTMMAKGAKDFIRGLKRLAEGA
ncbi:SRPBCC family protein [Pseudonocardia sp.]|jgi:ribosome-associated toxin RatA of RatAB toxin-antitoxin module|uniref:SRPBCC family protein n=1 Tax=Pseudonocardia sp. TaxID=60912 RepID=UPI00261C7AE5|nr:SRPBCC family protein [Pseudonocardia sp.]MCW2718659.1 hypothetical protein [Pseudonocardia sp.]